MWHLQSLVWQWCLNKTTLHVVAAVAWDGANLIHHRDQLAKWCQGCAMMPRLRNDVKVAQTAAWGYYWLIDCDWMAVIWTNAVVRGTTLIPFYPDWVGGGCSLVNCKWRLYSFHGEISVTMCQLVKYENTVEYHQHRNDRKDHENWLFEIFHRYAIKTANGWVQIPGYSLGKMELTEMSKYHIWQIWIVPHDNILANSVCTASYTGLVCSRIKIIWWSIV